MSHQPVLPPDTGLVYPRGGEATRHDVYHLDIVDIIDIVNISRARPLITLSILLVSGDLEAHLHTPAADACYVNESPELRSLSTTLSTDIIVWLLAIQRIFYVK